ncbi:MAG: phosphohydrolase [Deltaproteobacteria bacterium]|nr:MAG: phosphohydrolase [Deltaproteobacteria bacterium]
MTVKRLVKFLFEVGILKKTPRTGYRFLGTGDESVASHSFRTAVIGYCLCSDGAVNVDREKVVLMCLFHDIAEARTGDHNYVYQKYVIADEEKALNDQLKDLPFADEIKSLLEEFNKAETEEAKLAKDADQLDLILELKTQLDLGNKNAKEWIDYAIKRLHTEKAKEIAQQIINTHMSEWWFTKDSDWWIKGNRKK